VTPQPLTEVIEEFARHLAAERNRTEHTVRAYVGDITNLAEHLSRRGHTSFERLDLATLRSWLAGQQTRGRSRATLSRRASAARASITRTLTRSRSRSPSRSRRATSRLMRPSRSSTTRRLSR
jgi:site-specific recombinase XerD